MDNIEIVATGLIIPEQDKQSVLQLATELDRRWNERDAVAFADLFETDGDFRFHTGYWIKGKASIEDFWRQQVFPGLSEGMRMWLSPSVFDSSQIISQSVMELFVSLMSAKGRNESILKQRAPSLL